MTRTTNLLLLADNQGPPLAGARPQAGNHHDLFDIETLFAELCDLAPAAQVRPDGLFLNAASGCDARTLRAACFRRDGEANSAHNVRSAPGETGAGPCFGPERCRQRMAIEHTNAWPDRFKPLLVRYETNVQNGVAFRFPAFIVLPIRKIFPDEKP